MHSWLTPGYSCIRTSRKPMMPRQLTAGCDSRRDSERRPTDCDLQVTQYGILDKGGMHKDFATTCDVLLDTSKTFANVDDIQPILDRVDTAFYLS
jgi:hypothetical protein